MAAMGRCLFVYVFLALGVRSAAYGRTRQPDEMSSSANGMHNEASGQITDSQGGRTAGAVKDTVDRPPKSLRETGDSMARITGVPTQAPIDGPADVPRYFGHMFWTTLTMNFLSVLVSFLLSLLLVFILAWLYARYKEDPVPTHEADRLAWARQQSSHSVQGDWRFGLCECYKASALINCLACCCPSIRWADTMRMTGIFTFWIGFLLFASLYLLNGSTAGLSGLVLLIVVVLKRQELRKKFNMQTGAASCALDCCTYLCCGCCAIVQEAQQIEEAFAVGHPALWSFESYKLRPNMPDYAGVAAPHTRW